MARLSWSEIAARTAAFADRWEGETYEKGEAQSFWTEFLEAFGVDRRRAGGYFEYAVKLNTKRQGFVDVFLPGKLLVEHKSHGRDLHAATSQALGYLDGLDDHDLPEAIIACDFERFTHRDLRTGETTEFTLSELKDNVRLFGPLIEQPSLKVEEQNPVSLDAAERMAMLHRDIQATGFTGHALEVFLVRLVFCLFADDSRIFEPGQFHNYIANRTQIDGSDLGPRLRRLFEVLNTPPASRSTALDPELAAFEYVNGGLFSEDLPVPDFTSEARQSLLHASAVDWSKVSPAIFGGLFQGVMDDEARHDLGAHYTSEQNILRVIKPLILDPLYAELETALAYKQPKRRLTALAALHDRIAQLRILDPACGSGNFLVIAYRELRRLEHRIMESSLRNTTLVDVGDFLKVRVEQFAGIEIDDFAAEVARTALWLTDHQMNLEASERMGTSYARIPLTDGPHIVRGNALALDWNDVVPAEELDYIVGNPPFLGSRVMSKVQKAEIRAVAKGFRTPGFLDYVAAWYILADQMLARNPSIEVALVSTNSIAQGEQPSIIWGPLLERGNTITFAHRTFEWTNGARGVARVHCVVIGFTRTPRSGKRSLFHYPDLRGEPVLELVDNIGPYLTAGGNYVVGNRSKQISGGPDMRFGNMPADGGALILSADERADILAKYPEAEPWIRPYLGAHEFIRRTHRYCLWLDGVSPGAIARVPPVYDRVRRCREIRAMSSRPQLADAPALFAQRTQDPRTPFLLIPAVSSEKRQYVPIAFFEGGQVAANSCMVISDAPAWLGTLLTSRMHMDWLRLVGGRLKSDLRYSRDVVYNNFPFPRLTDEQRAKLGELWGEIEQVRALYPNDGFDVLYDPTLMPPELRAAHRIIDMYVDRLYSPGGFDSSVARTEALLSLVAAADLPDK